MTESQTYDIAVIGYGPAGVTAANLLGARGLRVVVIEREPSIYARARAISTDEEVIRIWQSAGLADRLTADMLPDLPLEFVDDAGRPFISARPKSLGYGYSPQQFIYQPAVETVLREGVDRFPNVEVRLHRECVRVRQDGDGVELLVADHATDTFDRVRARYVIAADGGSSPTRGQLGIGFEGRTYEDKWVVIDTKMHTQWPGHDRLRFWCDPNRPAVDCPTPLDHHRWEFPVLPGENADELVADAAVWRLLNHQGITDENVEILRAVVYNHHVRFADRWRVGRVFLVGDAAHVMPPWIGQGMAAGVRDVANLSWKLAAVVNGELPDSVLDSYQTERMPHVRDITKRAVFVGRVITERNPLLTAVRNPAVRTLNAIPVLGERFRDSKWIPEPHYPQGFLANPAHPAVGRKIPQPWVRNERGDRVRLDDYVGPGWAVLHIGPAKNWTAWTAAGVPAFEIEDRDLVTWMRSHKATALVLRPDRFVYAAAPGGTLPPPPAGLHLTTSHPTTTTLEASK